MCHTRLLNAFRDRSLSRATSADARSQEALVELVQATNHFLHGEFVPDTIGPLTAERRAELLIRSEHPQSIRHTGRVAAVRETH